MSLTGVRMFKPATGHLTHEAKKSAERLNVSVVFTSIESTLSALKHAGTLAQRLGARITMLVPQVVPYPLPLSSPPVLVDWNERRLRVVASGSAIETKVCIYLCRDRLELLLKVLNPGSLIVLAGRKRWWWPTPETRLAKNLRRAGHEVVLTETE